MLNCFSVRRHFATSISSSIAPPRRHCQMGGAMGSDAHTGQTQDSASRTSAHKVGWKNPLIEIDISQNFIANDKHVAKFA